MSARIWAGQEDAGITELADSIAEKGLLQPLIVRPASDSKYEVIAGQRRLEACRLLNMQTISCSVQKNCSDEDAVSLSLVENIQRADMAPLDKAAGLKALHDRHGSYERVAKETGLSQQTVKKYIDLNSLLENLKEQLNGSDSKIPVGPLFELAKRYDGNEAVEVYSKVSGFNGALQTEIIKRSRGDINLIDNLVEDAQEGAFDIMRCDRQYGCQVIRDIIAGEISEEGFEEMVQAAALQQKMTPPSATGKNPVHEFWKALANQSKEEETLLK